MLTLCLPSISPVTYPSVPSFSPPIPPCLICSLGIHALSSVLEIGLLPSPVLVLKTYGWVMPAVFQTYSSQYLCGAAHLLPEAHSVDNIKLGPEFQSSLDRTISWGSGLPLKFSIPSLGVDCPSEIQMKTPAVVLTLLTSWLHRFFICFSGSFLLYCSYQCERGERDNNQWAWLFW